VSAVRIAELEADLATALECAARYSRRANEAERRLAHLESQAKRVRGTWVGCTLAMASALTADGTAASAIRSLPGAAA
jgi:hypothetical protein